MSHCSGVGWYRVAVRIMSAIVASVGCVGIMGIVVPIVIPMK